MMRTHTISFKNAIKGLFYALKTQPNYKFHFFFSFLAILGAFILKISYFELILIIFLIFTGLTVETINTTIEAAADAIDKEWREDIKLVKDASAAAMLVFALGAFIIAAIIFIPKILLLFRL